MMRLFAAVLVTGLLNLYAGMAALERFIASEVADETPPSASVAVLRGSEIVYEQSFGYNDPDHRYATTPQSIYNLYSLSKIVTATAVMRLAQSNTIALDDPVALYFPRFLTRYEGNNRPVTIKQLLMHTSGVTDRSGDYRHMFDDMRYAMMKASGEEMVSVYELDYEPGSEAQYSNVEYIVLGYLIEKVTGRAFEEAIGALVLHPAGMETAGFGDLADSQPPEREVFGTLAFFSWMGQAMRLMIDDEDKERCEGTLQWLKRINVEWSAAGGLKGSLRDMERFLAATQALKLYDKATYRRFMHTPPVRVDTTFSKFDRVRFGIGWYHLEKDDTFFYQHQGIGPGFRNIMRIYPEHNLSLVILTSQTGTDIDAWADRVFEASVKEFE